MKLKTLVKMMAAVSVAGLPVTTALYASDLSLYKGNTTGKTSILLMLDTSGSMGISSLVLPKTNQWGSPGDVDSSLCDRIKVQEYDKNRKSYDIWEWTYNAIDTRSQITVNGKGGVTNPTKDKSSFYKEVKIGSTIVPYYVRGCSKGGVTQYDRLSRLKDAILPLLASNELSDDISMGLGQFSSKTELTIGTATNRLTDGHSGRILVANRVLSNAQRIKIAQKIAAIQSLDTRTNEDGTKNEYLKLSSNNYPNVTKASSGTPTTHAYAEAGAYMMGTGTGTSGSNSGKVQVIYDGYMVKQQGNNDGQIYFLCAELGGGTTETLGATVKQCPSGWPGYSNNTATGTIYRPRLDSNGNQQQDSSGKLLWDSVSSAAYKAYVKNNPKLGGTNGVMNSLWDVYKNLPIGWRFDGWMRVDNEPMDVEPVVGTVWTYGDSIRGVVSYRTNPFLVGGTTDSMVGGFAFAATDDDDIKNGSVYKAGGSTSSCDGNGIYFLTDGAPNSTKDNMAQTIMNTTLSSSSYQFKAKPTGGLDSPKLKSDLFSGETGGWEYIGEYSRKLLDSTKNPGNMKIKTAVVGFGSSFAGIPKNGDGSYNCEAVKNTNQDAYNACLWGGSAYGDGGFYYAENSDDIKNSIIKFVDSVSVSFTPSSLGSISVPRDPLDQTQVMDTGFFPMILPQEGSGLLNWAGNLKKYKIVGGTLKDSSNNAIYKTVNNQQIINSSAKDLWSIADIGTDHSLVNSGGTWNKIPVPSTLNVISEPSRQDSTRNVFVMDGTQLRRVTKENLATDYSGSTPSALDLVNIGVAKRYSLLNYLGYKALSASTLTAAQVNTVATTPASPYRYLGGVVHSTPLVITDSVTLSSSGNTVGSRKEYVVYGSMEGGLHVVDASTGEEKSVFVPKEVLDNQDGKSLANAEFKDTGTLSYGVDAPWTADNTFKVVSTVSNGAVTTRYEATKMNVYGGLRMGGSAFYGLNISSPSTPSLLFHITPGTAGFSRMGQIWSKPTIADIRVKGERKRVLIFGGGYDASVYEKPTGQFTEPTTSTKGNAIYIVDAKDGKLIWMASSDTAGIAESYKKITSSEMLYSVTGQPVVRDYDADGLADMIYFGDLGGQIFRVDLNNVAQATTATDVNVGVRVKRIANLRTGSGSSLFVPRFYERLTTAVFGTNTNRFVLVTAGSGNRSFPLEGSNKRNKIYGILDYDAAIKGIEKTTYADNAFKAVATNDNLLDRGVLGKTSTTINNWGGGSISDDKAVAAMGPTGTYRGWRFDLRSTGDEAAKFYAQSFEESQLISKDLYVNLYDSKAVLGGGTSNACGGGVQGLSTTHRICAPYADCAAYVKQDYQGILGPILGLTTEGSRTSGLVGSITATEEQCVGKCPSSNTTLKDQNIFNYSQSRQIKPTKWYER
ncbi:hypothetical protein CDG60_16485 [Acinetobacter chinensis]|uniref:Uncharacterized protein n=1 Tax=Acinetobacter chinensis TaxID=2004650 RepID=A0A3B7M062_9GAMM|nr:hypothetical protein CDG60_16485 [Acinetobacter chinensis]